MNDEHAERDALIADILERFSDLADPDGERVSDADLQRALDEILAVIEGSAK